MTRILSSSKNLTVYAQPKPYALLVQGDHQPRLGEKHDVVFTDSTNKIPEELLEDIRQSRIVALDFETRGLDPTLPDNYIVGIGLAGDTFSVYIPVIKQLPPELLSVLCQHRGLVAHNWYFDGQWLQHISPNQYPIAHSCTFAAYKLLATEGWDNQTWGLKNAMVDLLGWQEPNTRALDEWLVTNGYKKGNNAPEHGEMWRAPNEILGGYCVLDAEATYLLYTRVLEPALNRFPTLRDFLLGPFMRLIQESITQRLVGMIVDADKMKEAADTLEQQVLDIDKEIREMPEVAAAMKEWEDRELAEFRKTEPARYRKFELPPEPAKLTKRGEIQARWAAWEAKRLTGPMESLNWVKWKEREAAILRGDNPDYKFSFTSGPAVRWMFFEKLGYEPADYTETGLPAISSDVMGMYGRVGRAMIRRNEAAKELTYVTAYLELIAQRQDSTLHPSFQIPGTLTGRLSGRNPNIAQMPKTKKVMGAIVARPGKVLVDLDFAALETVVAAEISEDKSLLALYQDPNKVNDIYLFTGAHIAAFREKILATGYDPYNPTPEGLAAAKKACKHERTICKTVVLGAQYGAGPRKLHKTLTMNGVEISEKDVRAIYDDYWALYAGIRRLQRGLENDWRDNKGYVLNGIGRPIGVHSDYLKDLVNRTCQSTGHDLLVMYIDIVCTELRSLELDYTPFIIDWHDAVTLEVDEDDAKAVAMILEWGVLELNKRLGGIVPLRGKAVIGKTLADVKEPEND